MNDNQLPTRNQPDEDYEDTSTHRADQQSIHASSGEPGQMSASQGSLQESSPRIQPNINQPVNPLVDRSLPTTGSADNISSAWLDKNLVDEMRSRWNAIQVQFVDSPCAAVEQGEALVAEIMERLNQILTDQQNSIDRKWLSHDDISTEELRLTLRDYRTFMDRLLKI